jgi:transposase
MVGVDVSKLIQSVADLNNVCFVMEATGGYGRKPSQFLIVKRDRRECG